MTSKELIKLAQLQGALRHELRQRYIKKAAEESREDEIARLKKERDRGWFEDILGGMGWGSLYGTGIGGVGGGALGYLSGSTFGNMADQSIQTAKDTGIIPQDDTDTQAAATAVQNMAKDYSPMGFGILGGLGGISMGLPVGGTIGGLWRAATHNSRRQRAIDRLKELGVESEE